MKEVEEYIDSLRKKEIDREGEGYDFVEGGGRRIKLGVHWVREGVGLGLSKTLNSEERTQKLT